MCGGPDGMVGLGLLLDQTCVGFGISNNKGWFGLFILFST